MGALQLGHGGHEGVLGHVALHGGHEWLLVGRVQWLGELDRLQGGQAAAHAVDDGHTLCLCRSQAWSRRGSSEPGLLPPPLPPRPPGDTIPPSQSQWVGGGDKADRKHLCTRTCHKLTRY